MCHDPAILSPFMTQQSTDAVGDTLRLSESITHLPFKLEVLKLLPRCQQAEILCSMLIEGEVDSQTFHAQIYICENCSAD